jgi:hypothetical protein
MITLHLKNGLKYNISDDNWNGGVTTTQAMRYLKGLYTNKERFISRFVSELPKKYLGVFDKLVDMYDDVTPFTFKEAFELGNNEFMALVFGSINIREMIDELGSERIKVDGLEVKRKSYSPDGEFLGWYDYHSVYETHKVDGTKLGVEDELYVLKCWCTSTNKEHYLWIKPEFKDDPLSAIASTFIVAENIIKHIKALKRQGDVMLVELDSDVTPDDTTERPLTKEEYFGLLVAES